VLTVWPGRDRLDASRIGIFGFSVGGFTALVAIGGVPELGRIPAYCAEHPDRVCGMLKGIDTSVPASAWAHDARFKAAVIAAPTLAFTFGPESLAPVKVPVQLWRAAGDEITPHPRAAEAIYQTLPIRPDYMVVADAGHFAFVACSPEMAKRAPPICHDAPGFDREAFQRRLSATVVAFFSGQLRAER
jgi:predicted dienelactone hydrolase